MTTLLLVHGAWHGAWAWEALLPELRARGADTRTVQLPSVGDPAADERSDVAVVRAALDEMEGRAVLVGHSYGGVVITDAAVGRQDVHRLVYVTAFAPDAGESLLDQVDYGPLEWIVPAGEGLLDVDRGQARELFYADVAEPVAAAAQARLQPQAAASFAQPVQGAAWRDIPSTFVVCGEDRCIPPTAQRRWSARMTDTVELPNGHSPFLSRPAALADILVAAL